MPYRDPDPTDPNLLVGVELPADRAGIEEMAYVFAEEFVRLGFSKDRLLSTFQNPFYAAPHKAFLTLGQDKIETIIEECVAIWGQRHGDQPDREECGALDSNDIIEEQVSLSSRREKE